MEKKRVRKPKVNTNQLLLNLTQSIDNLALEIHKKQPEIKPSWFKFIVFNRKLLIYTTVTAENIHHACNKATKYLRGEYTGITLDGTVQLGHYLFKSIGEYNTLVKQSQKLT